MRRKDLDFNAFRKPRMDCAARSSDLKYGDVILYSDERVISSFSYLTIHAIDAGPYIFLLSVFL